MILPSASFFRVKMWYLWNGRSNTNAGLFLGFNDNFPIFHHGPFGFVRILFISNVNLVFDYLLSTVKLTFFSELKLNKFIWRKEVNGKAPVYKHQMSFFLMCMPKSNNNRLTDTFYCGNLFIIYFTKKWRNTNRCYRTCVWMNTPKFGTGIWWSYMQ